MNDVQSLYLEFVKTSYIIIMIIQHHCVANVDDALYCEVLESARFPPSPASLLKQ